MKLFKGSQRSVGTNAWRVRTRPPQAGTSLYMPQKWRIHGGATGLEGTQELWETAQALTDVVPPPSPQFFIVVKYI